MGGRGAPYTAQLFQSATTAKCASAAPLAKKAMHAGALASGCHFFHPNKLRLVKELLRVLQFQNISDLGNIRKLKRVPRWLAASLPANSSRQLMLVSPDGRSWASLHRITILCTSFRGASTPHFKENKLQFASCGQKFAQSWRRSEQRRTLGSKIEVGPGRSMYTLSGYQGESTLVNCRWATLDFRD